MAHIETTAQEILRQTENKVHGFICSVGTGGTLAGTAEGLKEKNNGIVTGLCDPMGSALYNFLKKMNFLHLEKSITEGIGTTRLQKL